MKKNLMIMMISLLFIVSLFGAVMAQSSDNGKVRLYLEPTSAVGEQALRTMKVQNSFDGIVSVEVSVNAVEHLLNSPHFISHGEATQWAIAAKPTTCSPWPSCKNDVVEPEPQTRPYLASDQTPWGIEAVYNNPSITETYGGVAVTVAVLDTGANVNHLDLVNRVTQCKDFLKRGVRDGCFDNEGHGTHTAGTVAADGGIDNKGIYGVAPQAQLFIYKVCGTKGCWSDDVSAAIIHAVDQGANILSISIVGLNLATIERDAIDYAVSNDVLVIAAAGNTGSDLDTIAYPAAYHKVVAVASLDSNLSVSDFSSRGINNGDGIISEREVELALPGRNVESTWDDGGYNTMSGTSMATPHASGLAAKHWQGSAQATRTWLQTNAVLHDIVSGTHAGVGDDAASGFGFPQVR